MVTFLGPVLQTSLTCGDYGHLRHGKQSIQHDQKRNEQEFHFSDPAGDWHQSCTRNPDPLFAGQTPRIAEIEKSLDLLVH